LPHNNLGFVKESLLTVPIIDDRIAEKESDMISMQAESRLICDENGWWNLQIRPMSRPNNCWSTLISSRDRSGLDEVADWWQGRMTDWTDEGEDELE
jgi:hypothetical protein